MKYPNLSLKFHFRVFFSTPKVGGGTVGDKEGIPRTEGNGGKPGILKGMVQNDDIKMMLHIS